MELKINSKKHGEFIVIIDDEDYNEVKKYNWSASIRKKEYSTKIYIETRTGGDYKLLHRLIKNFPTGFSVDHINGNTLDNRKSNLRICSHKENCRNVSKSLKKTSSVYKGVSFDKKSKKYHSYIKVNQKRHHLGYFETEDQASIAYNIAAVKYFGEFARPNINIMMHK